MRSLGLILLLFASNLASAELCGDGFDATPRYRTTLISQNPTDREFDALVARYEQLGKQLAPAAARRFSGFDNRDFDRQDVLNYELNAIGAALRGWLTLEGHGMRYRVMRVQAFIALRDYSYLETRRLTATPVEP